MASIDIWIQLENHPWDICPNWPLDRSEGEGAMPVGPLKQVFLRSPVSGKSRLAIVHGLYRKTRCFCDVTPPNGRRLMIEK